MNRGSFVRGGIQQSTLKKEDAVHEPLADQRRKGLEAKPIQQFSQQKKPERDEKTIDYEQKLKEAGEKVVQKTTESIILAARERMQSKRERLRAEAHQFDRYDRYSTQRRDNYGNNYGRSDYGRDCNAGFSSGGGSYARDNYNSGGQHHYSRNARGASYANDPRNGYLDKDGNYVSQASDNKPVRIYKNVNVNRDVDDFMGHTEARGWLHNWCKCMGFEKPMYDTEEVEMRKGKKKYKATLKIQTRFGEELDIVPEYTDTNKRGALTEVAWMFIEECVKRGLLDDNLVPHRETSGFLKNRNGVSKEDMRDSGMDFTPEAHAEGGFWKLGNCVQRITAFCYAIRQPFDIQYRSVQIKKSNL